MLEGQSICAGSQRIDIQGKREDWGSFRKTKARLSSLFPLTPLDCRLLCATPTSLPSSHTYNYANPVNWAFLTQVDLRVNYHNPALVNLSARCILFYNVLSLQTQRHIHNYA